MPGQILGPNYRTPFGKPEFIGSTEGLQFESWTVCRVTVPDETIDGYTGKILRPGQVMAVITSTPAGGAAADIGKIGPFNANVADGRQTLTNIVGVNSTFLPWQFDERDTEVAVLYDGYVFQDKCFEYDGSGALIALTDATAAAMLAKKFVDISCRRRALVENTFGTDETGTGW